MKMFKSVLDKIVSKGKNGNAQVRQAQPTIQLPPGMFAFDVVYEFKTTIVAPDAETAKGFIHSSIAISSQLMSTSGGQFKCEAKPKTNIVIAHPRVNP